MNWLSTTRVNSREQLQEYINTFKLNVVHAKYDELKDTATLISYFSTGIPTWIMYRIQAMDTVPTTLALWYEKLPTSISRKRSPEKLPSCITEIAPNHPALTRTFAHQTLALLVIQTPWISMH